MPKKKPASKAKPKPKARTRAKPNPRKYPATVIENKSIYRGVTWCKATSRWLAQSTLGNAYSYLGQYASEVAAAGAYNSAVLEYLRALEKQYPGKTLFDIGRVSVRMNDTATGMLTQKLQCLLDIPEGLTYTELG